MMKRALLLSMICLLTHHSHAQSLGDAARKERERRKGLSPEVDIKVINDSKPAPVPNQPPTPVKTETKSTKDSKPVPVVKSDEKPAEGETTHYYDINFNSIAEMDAAWRRLSPIEEDGIRYAGLTTWTVEWHADTTDVGGMCGISNIEAHAPGDMLLPRWPDEAKAPAPLREAWQRFSAALLIHEQGHRNNGRDAAAAVEALRSTPPQISCQTLISTVTDAAMAVIQHYHDLDKRYDAQTNHGLTQGSMR